MGTVPTDELLDRRIDKDKLIDLGNGEYKYNGELRLHEIGLKSLKDIPYNIVEVTGDCYFFGNYLTSLEGSPKIVGDYFDCSFNKLLSLEGCPEKVGGDFCCWTSPAKFTEEYVRSLCDVGGDVNTNS